MTSGLELSGGSPAPSARKAIVLDIGLQDYERTYDLQHALNHRCQAGEIPDTLVLVEHPPCLTLGRSSHWHHILASQEELRAKGISLYETDRGGDVTYHGPGQLVLYGIVDLCNYGKDVHAHARRLEQVLIDALASFGVGATRVEEYPGVWTPQGKIGTLGVFVKRWVTLHGVALNVSPDMTHFSCIVPCGIADHGVTSLAQILGHDVDMATVKSRVRTAYEAVFDVSLYDQDLVTYTNAERGING